jgi:hypothetical protein
MIKNVIEANPEAVRGTELDPVALRNRRDKLIARAEELLPKQPTQLTGDDVAAQLKNAMRANAFGDLRFSGRDPVEVVDELRTQWVESGPVLDEIDRSQLARFEEICEQVLAAAKRPEPEGREPREDRGERGGRRRRDRRERPAQGEASPRAAADTAAVVAAAAATESAAAMAAPVPMTSHDAITAPAQIPFEPLPAPPVPEQRAKTPTAAPPPDEVDEGWDLPDDDPTAKPETPSSSEMAGDGATGGDGIDEPGWD